MNLNESWVLPVIHGAKQLLHKVPQDATPEQRENIIRRRKFGVGMMAAGAAGYIGHKVYKHYQAKKKRLALNEKRRKERKESKGQTTTK